MIRDDSTKQGRDLGSFGASDVPAAGAVSSCFCLRKNLFVDGIHKSGYLQPSQE